MVETTFIEKSFFVQLISRFVQLGVKLLKCFINIKIISKIYFYGQKTGQVKRWRLIVWPNQQKWTYIFGEVVVSKNVSD